MKLEILKKELLEPLKIVVSATEQRSTLPILANILLRVNGNKLILIGSDDEIEISSIISLENNGSNANGDTTVNAKKLYSIVQNLNDDSLSISVTDDKATILAGKSKFSLSCLPVSDYPNSLEIIPIITVKLSQKKLKSLLSKTSHAMAISDPRYYLNGVCFDFIGNTLNVVATDGHRLAISSIDLETENTLQVIIPVKAVIELQKALGNSDDLTEISINENEFQAKITDALTIKTKLIDGKFPDYHGVIPDTKISTTIESFAIKSALTQVRILSHERHKGCRLAFDSNKLVVSANNPDDEKAECELDIDYSGDQFEIGFNTTYLLDALHVIDTLSVSLNFRDENSSVVISPLDDKKTKMVVMPMRI